MLHISCASFAGKKTVGKKKAGTPLGPTNFARALWGRKVPDVLVEKRVLPHHRPFIGKRLLKRLAKGTPDERILMAVKVNSYPRPIITRLDRSNVELEREWRIVWAYHNLVSQEHEVYAQQLAAKRRLYEAALGSLPEPLRRAASVPRDLQPPAHLRFPTLTPPLQGYIINGGVAATFEEESQTFMERSLVRQTTDHASQFLPPLLPVWELEKLKQGEMPIYWTPENHGRGTPN
eukprot:TRINITY_DN53655_c0_g1_i1.p1 TRINITY_DN53655_c0_g1~~TRINITY_DN53655_c0_g1_i1.p1  ORF type:complete len:234 (-),score=29.57 TRINITY_DN53655_c0_g1_i1:46-747(-)